MDILSYEQARKAIKLAIKANQPIGLEGPPGVGKSAIMASIAGEVGLPLETMILSLCDPTDVGGYMVVNPKGEVDRLPLAAIRRACEEPVLLFQDELSTATPAVQAADLRLTLERVAGDRKLHPGTRIVMAWNPPDQAAGGFDLALPLMGRITRIKFAPTLAEVQAFFMNLEPGSPLNALAVDFGATLDTTPGMLQIQPPAGAQSQGAQWGAPRNWERGLRAMAEALADQEDDQGPIVGALLAGAVGEECAGAFLAVRKIRNRLPSIPEILKDPKGCALPADSSVECAVPGVLAQVALADPCSAFVYATRLNPEIQIVSARTLIGRSIETHKKSPHFAEAQRARVKLLGLAGRANAGVI